MKAYGTTRREMDLKYLDRGDLTDQGREVKPAAKRLVRKVQKTAARRAGKAACRSF